MITAFLPSLALKRPPPLPRRIHHANRTHHQAAVRPISSQNPHPHPVQSPTPPDVKPLKPRDLDIVITHSSADFDSLAAAVGLAKLRGPLTLVVTPGGEGPSLRRFLALHRQLFKIIDAKAIDPDRLRWVGVVDTVRLDRLGVASSWPARAEHVVVFDHHIGRQCDIHNDNLDIVVENVGAVATLICERLRDAGHCMTSAEATLLALAIHSDTGSLTFEQTTPRDASMLSWLMEQGALQRSIAEFTQTFLTDEQQMLLSQGLSDLSRRNVNGVEIGSLVLVGRSFMKGMSAVTQDLLEIANLDVLLLCYVNCRGRRAKRKATMDDGAFCGPEQLKQVSIIGRARARVDGVDFRSLFAAHGGGGHARAASMSLKATEADAEVLVEELVDKVAGQVPDPRPVGDFMSVDVVTIFANACVKDAARLMALHDHRIIPVVDADGVLKGLISLQDVKLAERKGGEGGGGLSSPVGAWMHQNVATVQADVPFFKAERSLEESIGMLPVVDEDGKLVGALGRTDVLIARRLWPEKVSEF